jgi:hypothetical protein
LTISKYIIAALQKLLLSTLPVKKKSFPTGSFIVFPIEADIELFTSGQYQNRCSIVSFGAGKFFFIIQNVHSGEVSALLYYLVLVLFDEKKPKVENLVTLSLKPESGFS